MKRLIERAAEIARTAQQQRIGAIAGRLREAPRAVRVEEQATAVILSGRGLLRRWLNDASFRFMVGGRA